MDENDILIEIEDFLRGKQNSLTRDFVVRFEETDSNLGLPPGSTGKYIERVAKELGFEIPRKGSTRISLRNPDGINSF
jgi:hypothetical protein